MIRIVGDKFSWNLPYVDKAIECWHCKGGIVFKHVVPFECPKCKAKQPDAENLIGLDKKLAKKSKLIYYRSGELGNVNDYHFQ